MLGESIAKKQHWRNIPPNIEVIVEGYMSIEPCLCMYVYIYTYVHIGCIQLSMLNNLYIYIYILIFVSYTFTFCICLYLHVFKDYDRSFFLHSGTRMCKAANQLRKDLDIYLNTSQYQQQLHWFVWQVCVCYIHFWHRTIINIHNHVTGMGAQQIFLGELLCYCRFAFFSTSILGQWLLGYLPDIVRYLRHPRLDMTRLNDSAWDGTSGTRESLFSLLIVLRTRWLPSGKQA